MNKIITSKIIYKEILNYCYNEIKGNNNYNWIFKLSLVNKQWFNLLKKIINSYIVFDYSSLLYLEKRLLIIYNQQEGQKRLDYHNKYYLSDNLIYDNSRFNSWYSILNNIKEIKFNNLDDIKLLSESPPNQEIKKIINSIKLLIEKIESIKFLKFKRSDQFFINFKPYSMNLSRLSIKSSNKISFPLDSIGESIMNSVNLTDIKLTSFCYFSNPLQFLNALYKSNIKNFNLKIESTSSLIVDSLLEKNFSSFKVSGAKLFLNKFNQLINSPNIQYLNSPIHINDDEPLENIETFCENIKINKSILKLCISSLNKSTSTNSSPSLTSLNSDTTSTTPTTTITQPVPILNISKSFSTVFYYNNTIQSLCISGLQILSKEFFQSLKSNSSITHLELTDGSLNLDLLQHLSTFLTTPPSSSSSFLSTEKNISNIKYLSIRNNNLSDINSSIFIMLSNNQTLKGIDLSNNNFTIHQAAKIFESLSNNKYYTDNLYKIDFSNSCKFQSKESIKPINDYINSSKSIIAINLYNCYSFDNQLQNNNNNNNDIILFSKKFDYKTFFIV